MRPSGVSAVSAGQARQRVGGLQRRGDKLVEGHALWLREAHVAFDLADGPSAQRRNEVLADAYPGIDVVVTMAAALRFAVAVPRLCRRGVGGAAIGGLFARPPLVTHRGVAPNPPIRPKRFLTPDPRRFLGMSPRKSGRFSCPTPCSRATRPRRSLPPDRASGKMGIHVQLRRPARRTPSGLL
jgi:hypothetical protein